ncbi:hypothetical protein OSB04_001113 [Centaurea solstitialis]|uniref:protein-serine/threonine phosphatase n=1 Tax=Centaurea solstitialis TaxID=347529 RepID=A0AA38WLF1_9ASTR|nr:hypothetical protein OSB04_001113 [Centaurea solstitialis]
MITVAIPNSPVFSPSVSSSSIYCKSSPESSSSYSPAFKFRIPPASGLVRDSNDGGGGTNSPALSKRKRPAKLAIPVASFGFSGRVGPPRRRRRTGGRRWRLREMGIRFIVREGKERPWRIDSKLWWNLMDNINRYLQVICKAIFQAFFGVFDGHGGPKAAEFAAENLDKNILNEVEKRGEIEIIEAIKQGYMNTDLEFLNQDHRGGSCCLTAIIRDSNLVVSNAGDCRAVVSSGGVATPSPPITAPRDPMKSSESNL